jgi:YVTN family beta-propeller protein
MNRKIPNRINIILAALLLSNLLFIRCTTVQAKSRNNDTLLKLTVSIPLANVSGRIDHLAYDIKRQFVYIAALGNNTVEVVDVKNAKVVHTIKGLSEPQGIRYIAETNAIFVANGDNGVCDVFNADTYQKITSIKLGADADNVRYDSTAKRIYVGYGSGGIAIIDAVTFKQLADIKLPGHPESFQLDYNSKKLFVNVPDAHLIAVIDLVKNVLESKWKIDEASANFPMAFDTANHRMFIGCRHPAKLIVINSESGKTIASFDTDDDTDDIFYDSSTQRIYMSCGEGSVNIFKQVDPNKYEAAPKIETRSGARTSLFVPELNQLFIAAPARSGNEAQLMIYQLN